MRSLQGVYAVLMKLGCRTLENAAFYIQPFADALQQRFGMCVSVLLAGPMMKHGGAIGMQR